MRRPSILPTLLVLALACRGPASKPAPAPDDGLGEVLHTLVTDSLVGGGRRAGQRYVATDAASDTLLQAAGLATASGSEASSLACPGSTDTGGVPTASTVGYAVGVDRAEQVPGVLHLHVTVRCSFIYRGRAQGFLEDGTWELRRADGRWRVARTLGRGIT